MTITMWTLFLMDSSSSFLLCRVNKMMKCWLTGLLYIIAVNWVVFMLVSDFAWT